MPLDKEVTVLNMNKSNVSKRAKSLGIYTIPIVATDGQLVEYCSGREVEEASLRAVGLD